MTAGVGRTLGLQFDGGELRKHGVDEVFEF